MSNCLTPSLGNAVSAAGVAARVSLHGRVFVPVTLALTFCACGGEGAGAGRGSADDGRSGVGVQAPAQGGGFVEPPAETSTPDDVLVDDDGTPVVDENDDGDLVDGMVCNSKDIEFEKVIPTVMILVDRSTSMFDLAYGASPDRWEPMRQAVHALEPFSSDVAFSLATYTAVGGEATCPTYQNLDMVPATGNFEQIKAALPDSMAAHPMQKGETPTGEAMEAAIVELKKVETDGPKYLLLLTDGEPDTCTVRDPQCGQDWAVAAAQSAFTDGIRTYVVGISDDVKDNFLNDLAHAGQGKDVPTPEFDTLVMCSGSLVQINEAAGNVGFDYNRFSETAMGTYSDAAVHEGDLFYKPDNLETFQAQLGEIIAGVRSCSFEMDSFVNRAQADRGAVGFVLADGSIELLTYADANGWALSPTDDSIVELQGTACDKVRDSQADLVKTVKIEFPCDVRIPKLK